MTIGLCRGCWLASSSRMIWRRLTLAFLSCSTSWKSNSAARMKWINAQAEPRASKNVSSSCQPRRLHGDVAAARRGLLRRGLAGEIHVHARLAYARRQALGQAAESFLDHREPFAQVVGTRVELRVLMARIDQARAIAREMVERAARTRPPCSAGSRNRCRS